jgi:hypothetical protein
MDAFTQDHLAAWAAHTLRDDERDAIVKAITLFVLGHPDVINGRSWPEIRHLVERNARLGICA